MIAITRTNTSSGQRFTWATRDPAGSTVTSGQTLTLKANIYNPLAGTTIVNTIASQTFGGPVLSPPFTLDQDIVYGCLFPDINIFAMICSWPTTADITSPLYQSFSTVQSNTAWGETGATYNPSPLAPLSASPDLVPAGMIKLQSGGGVAVFYNKASLDAEGKHSYTFFYKEPTGYGFNIGPTIGIPVNTSSVLTGKRTALVQHPNGDIYFFSHVQDDTAIGLITLTEVGSPATGIVLSTVNANYIGTAFGGNSPYAGSPQLKVSVRPNPNQALDAIVLAYQSSTSTTLGSSTGTRLAFCSIARDGTKTFAQMPTKWVEQSADFEIGVDASTGTTIWFAADFLDSSGNAEGFITVANFTSSNWQFTNTVFTPQFYPIRDDFNSVYAGGVCSGFAWLAAGTLNFVPFSNYPYSIPSVPGEIQWAKFSTGSPAGQARGNCMAVDALGNSIVAGYFNGDVSWGLGNVAGGAGDAYLVKYNSTGTPLWVRNFGDVKFDTINGIATDSAGNIIVIGYFGGTVDFGGTSRTAVGTFGQPDIFVAKYAPGSANNPGLLLWVTRCGGALSDKGISVAVDSAGNVIATGVFASSNADFGSIILSSGGNDDTVVFKLEASTGNVVWAKKWGGTANDLVAAIAVTSTNDVLITGTFYGTANFGGGNMTASPNNLFIAKYSGVDGTPILGNWPKNCGNSASTFGNAIAVDPTSGNVIVTGGCNGAVDFGGGPVLIAGQTTGTACFVVAYSASGTYLWGKAFGDGFSSVTVQGQGVAVDSSGNVYVTGVCLSEMYTGEGWWTDVGEGYFLMLLNSNGVFQRGNVTSGGYSSSGRSVQLDSAGHVLTAGILSGDVNFGSGFVSPVQTNYSGSFVAQYNK